jgi:WD40 repeat protein
MVAFGVFDRKDSSAEPQGGLQPGQGEPVDEAADERLAWEREDNRRRRQAEERQFIARLKKTNAARGGADLDLLQFPGIKSVEWYHFNRLEFSPDGKSLAGSTDTRMVLVWDVATGKLLWAAGPHNGGIVWADLAFSPDGKQLAATWARGVRVWDTGSGAVRRTFERGLDRDPIVHLAFSADGKSLLGVEHGIFNVLGTRWDLKSGAAKPLPSLPQGRYGSRCLSPNGRLLAVADTASTVRIWDVRRGKALWTESTPKPARELTFSADGKSLTAIVGEDDAVEQALWVWDVATGKVRLKVRAEQPDKVALSPDGGLLVFATRHKGLRLHKEVQFWDVPSGKLKKKFPESERPRPWFLLAFSPGGELLASEYGGAARLFAVADLLDERLQQHLAAVKRLGEVQSRDGQVVLELSFSVTDADLANLKYLPRVTALDLWGAGLDFKGGAELTDKALAHLKALPRLKKLSLRRHEKFTDAGLAHLKDLKSLEELDLSWMRNLTDAGLAHLAKLKGLKALDVSGTDVTDAGLAHLEGLTGLRALRLDMKVTDAGLARLKGLTELRVLTLPYAKVTDKGLEHLAGMTKLEELDLSSSDITDAGLALLKGRTGLTRLKISFNDRITDAGLDHLRGLTRLKELDLAGTKVSDAGLAHLKGMTPWRTSASAVPRSRMRGWSTCAA